MEYTYKEYESILSSLKKNEYSFVGYNSSDKADKAVILRHDVDISLGKAVKIAELEYQGGYRQPILC